MTGRKESSCAQTPLCIPCKAQNSLTKKNTALSYLSFRYLSHGGIASSVPAFMSSVRCRGVEISLMDCYNATLSSLSYCSSSPKLYVNCEENREYTCLYLLPISKCIIDQMHSYHFLNNKNLCIRFLSLVPSGIMGLETANSTKHSTVPLCYCRYSCLQKRFRHTCICYFL